MAKRPSYEVLVVDSEKKFLEYTKPALARKYLKEGKAKVFSRNPFAIMLLHSKPTTSIRRKKMAIRNFTNAFREEKDIYVQNLANAQVSCEFPLGEGRVEGFTFPDNRDPINLTQHIPFGAIKSSMDFRKMLSRRPPALQLLSQEEYESYFAKRAKSRNLLTPEGEPDVDAAIDASEEKRRRIADRNMREPVADKRPDPIHEVVERGTGPGGAARFGERQRVAHDDIVGEDEIINPKVLHYCNQVKAELADEEKMSAQELLENLQDIPRLSMDDLEHVRAHGFYKTVKKWAKNEMSRMIQAEEAEDESSEEAAAG